MNTKEKYAHKAIIVMIRLFSVLMMLPLLFEGGINYYRTLFIFIINYVTNLFYKDEKGNTLFFKIWDVVNQLVGIFVCAISFCAMNEEFVGLFPSKVGLLNCFMMAFVASCMVCDLSEIVVMAIQTKIIEEKIKNHMNK